MYYSVYYTDSPNVIRANGSFFNLLLHVKTTTVLIFPFPAKSVVTSPYNSKSSVSNIICSTLMTD